MDTKPLIRLFAEEEGWEDVQKISSKVEAGEIEAAISVVTLIEIHHKYLQEERPDLAKTRTEESTFLIFHSNISTHSFLRSEGVNCFTINLEITLLGVEFSEDVGDIYEMHADEST